MQLKSLVAAYSTQFLTVGLCGASTEQIVKEREDGEQYIFQGLDRIMDLPTPELKTLVSSVANARWLLTEKFTGTYDGVLEEQNLKISSQEINVFK